MEERLFITFEGIEGSGKTTHADLLYQYLLKQKYKVLLAREPGATNLGEQIREVLLSPKSNIVPKAEALLYSASRAQYVSEVILPALNQGKIVISDRYIDSSLAYQGFGRNLKVEDLTYINKWASQEIEPDLTILLNLPAHEGLKRVTTLDRMEREDIKFHQRVQQGFLKLAKIFSYRFRIFDATRSIEENHAEIVQTVSEFLLKK